MSFVFFNSLKGKLILIIFISIFIILCIFFLIFNSRIVLNNETHYEEGMAAIQYYQILNAVVTVIIVSMIIFFFFSKYIEAPIKELCEKISNLQEGDMNSQFTYKNRDELGTLANCFNKMVVRLRETDMQIPLHHQEHMKRADKLANLGEVAAGIAHEINNPTGIILTRIGYLLHQAKRKKFSTSIIQDLKAIETLTIRISEIVKGLLYYSKATKSVPFDFSLNEVVDKMLAILELKLKDKNVRLYKNLCSSPSTIHADPSQIEQVVLNIVNNAVDAMPNGGSLIIKTEIMRKKKLAGHILLSFRDTGIGMPPATMNKIFTPFFTTKEGKGTGLGLTISDGIIRTHEGRIKVSSWPGKGSEFRIYLPLLQTLKKRK